MASTAARAEQKWTQPTAEELTMTSQAGAPGASAVMLFSEEIDEDSLHMTSVTVRLKVLTPAGLKRANVVVVDEREPIDEAGIATARRALSELEGRTIHPDGTIVPLVPNVRRRLIMQSLGRWATVAEFTMPDATVGCILEYRYKMRQAQTSVSVAAAEDIFPREGSVPAGSTPASGPDSGHLSSKMAASGFETFYPPTWEVQDDLYLRRGHFAWSVRDLGVSRFGEGNKITAKVAWYPVLPPGDKVVQTQAEYKSATGTALRARFELDVRDVPPVSIETDAPPAASNRYRVRFYYNYYPTVEAEWKAHTDFWRTYAELFVSPGAVLRGVVGSLVSPSDSDEEKLRKLYAAVMGMKNVDYSPLPLTPGLPGDSRNARDAWIRKRGNAAQMAGMFVGMARAAGMKAYFVAVGNRERETFAEACPSMAQLEDRIAIVVVDGKERFFDPGSRYCEYGHLAWNHTATKGLRETEKGTAFVETPVESYRESAMVRAADLALDAAGNATGKVEVRYTGAPALYWRQTFLAAEQRGLERKLTDDLKKRLPAGMAVSVQSVVSVAETDKPLTVSFAVSGKAASTAGARLLVPCDLLEAGRDSQFSAQGRTLPVVFDYAFATHDSVVLHLPAGYTAETAPPAVTVPFERYAAYSLKPEVADGTLTLRRDLLMGEIFFAPKDYAGLQSFYRTVEGKDREQIALQALKPQAAN